MRQLRLARDIQSVCARAIAAADRAITRYPTYGEMRPCEQRQRPAAPLAPAVAGGAWREI